MRLPQWRHQAMRIRRDLSGQWTSSECWHLEMKPLNTHTYIRGDVHAVCVIFLSLMMRHEWEAWDSLLLFRRELLNPGDNRGLWHERRYKYFYARIQNTIVYKFDISTGEEIGKDIFEKILLVFDLKKNIFLHQLFLFLIFQIFQQGSTIYVVN